MAHPLSEHIEYLTLPGRYELFQQAIASVGQPGDIVADLGCGVGVLGLQCLKAGAAKVYGIDSSDVIHLARESAARAGLAERYSCIASSTFSAELPEQASLLICDHIGHFGFDYGIVDMMRDAAERMLAGGGRVIPDKIRLHVAAVRSDACEAKAAAWSMPPVPEEFRWLDEQSRNSKFAYEFAREELCSDPAMLGESALGCAGPDLYRFESTLIVSSAGQFHGLAGWFSAHLGGGVWMTNSPLDPASITRSQAFLPVREAFAVEKGDQIGLKLRASSDGRLIAWTITPPNARGPAQKMSTFSSMILSDGDLTERAGKVAHLTKEARAAAGVLALVNGERTFAEIEALAMEQLSDTIPDAKARLELVQQILRRNAAP